MKKKIFGSIVTSALLASTILMQGCTPEVGSKEWCNDLREKPKGEWTANEAKDFAKHCIF